MRYLHILLWPLKFILFAILFGFAMQNAAAVRLHLFLDYAWNLPLSLLLLVFFMLGAGFGLLACLGRMARLRRELVALRREKRARGPATAAPVVLADVPRDAL